MGFLFSLSTTAQEGEDLTLTMSLSLMSISPCLRQHHHVILLVILVLVIIVTHNVDTELEGGYMCNSANGSVAFIARSPKARALDDERTQLNVTDAPGPQSPQSP